jgi:asparagine synthase (glutamine-hydrolysing)
VTAVITEVEVNGLTPLEIGSHMIFGTASDLDLPAPEPPIAALERTIRAALLNPPCLVTFSGGRDSSAMLGLAARVAEREGLQAPIALTAEFPGAARSEELEWQELVMRRVKVSDWVRRSYGDELDLVGSTSTQLMRRDGLAYPFNLHLMAPLIAEARGGSLITGVGGDQYLAAAGGFRDVLARRRRPSKRELVNTAVGLSPDAVRKRLLRDDVTQTFPWLTAEGNARLSSRVLERELDTPIRWNLDLRQRWRSRSMRLNLASLERVARQLSVQLVHPFADDGFVASIATAGGAFGFRTRAEVMTLLFGDLMPDVLNRRPTKAAFDEVLWTAHSRDFVGSLEPGELDDAITSLGLSGLVDTEALLVHWRTPMPEATSFLLLQACWLVLRG